VNSRKVFPLGYIVSCMIRPIFFNITNFMGHNLAIIIVWNYFFIGLYGIDTDVIQLLILFEHRCHVHCWDTNVICMFILFRHKCCVFICIVDTWKLCTQLSCLINAWHLCVNDMNPWNNRFHTNLEWTHEPIILWWRPLPKLPHPWF